MGTVLSAMFIAGALLVATAWKSPRHFQMPQFGLPSQPAQIDLAVWPDAVDDVASAIRAGMSLPQAVCHLAENGPEQLQPIFKQVESTYLSSGNFILALTHVRNLRQPIALKFVSALSVAYQVGGSELGTVLRALADAVRDEVKIRGEIEARQSWTVNGARLAIAAPWVTVLLLSSRNSAAQVYLSSAGLKLLTVCAVLSGFAYFIMLRIGKLPEQNVVAP